MRRVKPLYLSDEPVLPPSDELDAGGGGEGLERADRAALRDVTEGRAAAVASMVGGGSVVIVLGVEGGIGCHETMS